MADIEKQLRAIEGQVEQAIRSGRESDAARLWTQILVLAPSHVAALTAVGQRAFRSGDLASARAAFDRLTLVAGHDPLHWTNLALICQQQNDAISEAAAIHGALSADPSDLLALILRAELFDRQGNRHQAAAAFGAVATVAPPMARLAPQFRPAVARARSFRDQYDHEFGVFLDQNLARVYEQFGAAPLDRFRDSLDILVGRKRRYQSQPSIFYYPGLPTIEFFDRALFPWLDGFEADTAAIADEFHNVLRADAGFEPYINYASDVPVNQWAELNHNPSWSAFHLLRDGQRVADNAVQCPRTMQLLATVPAPDQPGRSPVAMFSLLRPQTRIPPHTGVSNVRLVAHVPLIVPEGCGFRVGNTTRRWVPGQAWVFDDTIEHEAWNDSTQQRAVLIFDVWHPHLAEEERALITALMRSINAFTGDRGGFEL